MLAVFERKLLQEIYENELGWKLRYKRELYELLDGSDTVKYKGQTSSQRRTDA
jgi:hypothetical protein